MPALKYYERDAFVRAVMDDVPKRDFMPEVEQIAKTAAERSMPKEVHAVWVKTKLRPWLAHDMPLMDGSTHQGLSGDAMAMLTSVRVPNIGGVIFNDEELHQLEALAAAWNEQTNHREGLRSKLKESALGCRTYKQLTDTFPELVKYMPKAVKATVNLPVAANVVADLVKAGWPKGGK